MDNRELDNLYIETEKNEHKSVKSPKRKVKRRMRGITGVLVGIVIGALACILVFSTVVLKSKATSVDLDYQSKLEIILSYLNRYYIDELDEQTLEDALAKGLMTNLGDKYAQYYTVDEFQRLMEETTGEYAGIGVLIVQADNGEIMVYQVYNNSPAKEAGIQIGDFIVEADGHREFEDMDELVSYVRGEPGTSVDIVIRRGDEEIALTVERQFIEVESVAGRMLDDTLGYIRLAEFNTTTVGQFKDCVESLKEQGMTEMIIDLRDNPGGDYDSVVAVCDYVLPEGNIVTVEDRRGGVSTEKSGPECLDLPIVLLVNENTASAAELFTMALMDYGMAESVGTLTYGKGIVQSIFQLMDGSGIKFTTERYYGPAGNCIQDTGIEPDYTVELPEDVYEDGVLTVDEDLQLQKAAELLGHDLPDEE